MGGRGNCSRVVKVGDHRDVNGAVLPHVLQVTSAGAPRLTGAPHTGGAPLALALRLTAHGLGLGRSWADKGGGGVTDGKVGVEDDSAVCNGEMGSE